MSREDFIRLKENPPVKDYQLGLKPEWLYEIGDYLMAYVIERHPIKDQMTLRS